VPNDRLGTEAVVCARGPDRPWYGPMRAMRKPSGVEGRAVGLTPGGERCMFCPAFEIPVYTKGGSGKMRVLVSLSF
jgi:hypothetical protein